MLRTDRRFTCAFSGDKFLLVFGAFLHVVVRPFIVEASPDGVVLVVAQQRGQVGKCTHSHPARIHTVMQLCLCIVISTNSSSTTAK